MSGFERLVRPLETPFYFPASQPASGMLNSPKTVLLSVGKKGGQIKVLEGGFSNTETKFMDSKSKTYFSRANIADVTGKDDPNSRVQQAIATRTVEDRDGGSPDPSRLLDEMKKALEIETLKLEGRWKEVAKKEGRAWGGPYQ